ncbi:UDP-N-acetylmuramoyl-tripeptide--D-alanyl-D-alanine ligase [Carbonactinospora thermoautotrophica]|uniref:UDP-N-acetylmuramoyl-tripeptide--D-alanyl-D-alanine ligase n=2 Tax=Carbonactinospora thermoautotrophica TaxID=1469144 RepID=A0A132MSF5_9ACTN|nr:UDP-N-acetylmuramoyl-tripeptide--D-alanyl-D-alanine ligase [Carbonactinospora thermoautotrophica]KWX00322.1 UDP-N-acetylmuramoyl-tripeptide--D-alanyl-D-alanine ligase [Carbonactinospora thermoautotrophica]KWX01588.1 UDP-N-acetylmuramoyl-tripeptide--D-alanyl-D-alanin e ligase [Carbonactinospora thermoautotrophica]
MISLSLAEVETLVGGRLHDVPDPQARITGPVVIDSRKVTPGALFAALRGERADGHDFAAQAVADGAVAVLAARPVGVPAVVVEDVTVALGRLAAGVVRRLPAAVVGVTGSSGKTSTKDLIAQLLRRLGPTVAPPGSYNNEQGLPLTVLSADAGTRYLVLEYGARGAGHITYLTGIARPRVGVVLNVGTAHLGEFGSREAIAAAKGELVEALAEDGLAVLNADDPLVAGMAARTRARVVTFGESARADVRAEEVTLDEQARAAFTLRTPDGSARVQLRLHGEHQVGNALAAACVAREFGMSVEETAAALSEATAVSRWRMEVTERPDGVTVVNDAYNANPDSVRAALKALVAMARGRRTWAVLGQMAELGDASGEEHDAIGRLAVRLDVNRLVVVGQQAARIHAGAKLEGSWGEESVFVPDAEAAVELLHRELRPGDVVLIKASRAAGLERIAEALLADQPEVSR